MPATRIATVSHLYRGERKEEKQTGRGEYDAAAAEGLPSGLVRLLHGSRRVFDSKETTTVGWGLIEPFQDRLTIRHSRQSIHSHNVGEHLSGRVFQCIRGRHASLGRRRKYILCFMGKTGEQ
jgi:hypothetical protein